MRLGKQMYNIRYRVGNTSCLTSMHDLEKEAVFIKWRYEAREARLRLASDADSGFGHRWML
ncbi:hypothetical protein IF1G_06840 [Cordyceps javanica]|uniref:Uncharacterized protein n=1 Tax=Cordyceps javanica TaxID=43265 RepID=A0A545UZH9_9HYPO|nr:hypothetical protein IF1G_06840 [Cordyceps javanica]